MIWVDRFCWGFAAPGRAALLAASLALLTAAEGPLAAREHRIGHRVSFLFDRDRQTHPREFVIAIPVRNEIAGVDDGPLTLGASYSSSLGDEDPRANRGRVVVRVKIVRADEVVWTTKLRDRVKNDPDNPNDSTGTTALWACDGFADSLLPGDLVLFEFGFKGLPRLNAGEHAELDAHVLPEMGKAPSDGFCND